MRLDKFLFLDLNSSTALFFYVGYPGSQFQSIGVIALLNLPNLNLDTHHRWKDVIRGYQSDSCAMGLLYSFTW
jgi:hypothetical protein